VRLSTAGPTTARPSPCSRWIRRLLGRVFAAVASIAAVAAVVSVAAVAPVAAQALQPVPPLNARVTDTTGTLDAAQRQALEATLAELEGRKGAQIAVLMVPTTQPEAIEQYSIRVAEAWKIGRGRAAAERASGDRNAPAIDDGVLLLIAKNDRRLRIEVGYGLEGAIPDGIAKRIIDESIAPRFRRQDWFGGIQAGVQDLRARIEGEPLPAPWIPAGEDGTDGQAFGILPILIFAFVAGSILSSVIGRFLGAGAAGLGAGVFGAAALASLALGVGAGLLVFVLVLMMAPSRSGLRQVGRRTYRDGPVILPGGWGGGRGGGFGGGGGFSGGGGGFGGGGASGDW